MCRIVEMLSYVQFISVWMVSVRKGGVDTKIACVEPNSREATIHAQRCHRLHCGWLHTILTEILSLNVLLNTLSNNYRRKIMWICVGWTPFVTVAMTRKPKFFDRTQLDFIEKLSKFLSVKDTHSGTFDDKTTILIFCRRIFFSLLPYYKPSWIWLEHSFPHGTFMRRKRYLGFFHTYFDLIQQKSQTKWPEIQKKSSRTNWIVCWLSSTLSTIHWRLIVNTFESTVLYFRIACVVTAIASRMI